MISSTFFFSFSVSNSSPFDTFSVTIKKIVKQSSFSRLSFFSSFVIVTDSPSVVTTQSSATIPLLSSCVNEQAQELLNTIVQLGNRQEIEQLRNKIKVK